MVTPQVGARIVPSSFHLVLHDIMALSPSNKRDSQAVGQGRADLNGYLVYNVFDARSSGHCQTQWMWENPWIGQRVKFQQVLVGTLSAAPSRIQSHLISSREDVRSCTSYNVLTV